MGFFRQIGVQEKQDNISWYKIESIFISKY